MHRRIDELHPPLELAHVDDPIKHITLVYNRAHVQFIVLTEKPNPDLRYMSVDFTHGSKKSSIVGVGDFDLSIFICSQLLHTFTKMKCCTSRFCVSIQSLRVEVVAHFNQRF